jgi:hypothetical protein
MIYPRKHAPKARNSFDTNQSHWPFYDAYHAALPTTLAVQAHDNSIVGFRLEKYLSMSMEKIRLENLPPNELLQFPKPLQIILLLQQHDGCFERLEVILQILSVSYNIVPILVYFSYQQYTTAFALFYIKQHCEMYETLRKYYDKSVQWLLQSFIHTVKEEEDLNSSKVRYFLLSLLFLWSVFDG